MDNKHILILGCGSVGKRHASNLNSLGCGISIYDPREDRRGELAAQTAVVSEYANLKHALADNSLDGVVVASPTKFHTEQTILALEKGLPVLLEKPPAMSLAGVEDMIQVMGKTDGSVLLGYTWRWWPPLGRVRQLLESNRIGRILHVQFHMSAHLADWHPWEPYQDFFMSSAEQGGGALLDESHWIDLMLWFFGKPASLYGQVEKNSNLEIESDDNVDVVVNYSDGKRITVHLDLYGRPHEKFIRIIGEKGTIHWSANPNRVSTAQSPEQEWVHEEFSFDRNDMFIGVAEEFLMMLHGGVAKTCGLEDGLRVMEVIEAVRQSHDKKIMVTF